MLLEGKGSFFILLFIVAFLSLTLAGLAGYVFFFAGPTRTAPTEQAQQQTVKERPSEDKLAVKKLFENKKIFNLKSTDDKKLSVIQVNVELVYLKSTKTIKDTSVKLTACDGEIKELIGTYFQNKTLEEVKLPETKAKAKEELKKEINKLLSQKEEIIYLVNFDDWFYQ